MGPRAGEEGKTSETPAGVSDGTGGEDCICLPSEVPLFSGYNFLLLPYDIQAGRQSEEGFGGRGSGTHFQAVYGIDVYEGSRSGFGRYGLYSHGEGAVVELEVVEAIPVVQPVFAFGYAQPQVALLWRVYSTVLAVYCPSRLKASLAVHTSSG